MEGDAVLLTSRHITNEFIYNFHIEMFLVGLGNTFRFIIIIINHITTTSRFRTGRWSLGLTTNGVRYCRGIAHFQRFRIVKLFAEGILHYRRVQLLTGLVYLLPHPVTVHINGPDDLVYPDGGGGGLEYLVSDASH